jgi:hypothetical protein
MKNSLIETNKAQLDEEFPMEYAEILPKNLAMPNGVQYENINLTMEKLKYLIVNDGGSKSPELADTGMVLLSPTPMVKKSMAGSVGANLESKDSKVKKPGVVTSGARSRSIATGKGRTNLKPVQSDGYADYKMNYEVKHSPEPKSINEHKKDIKEILRNRADKILGKKPKVNTSRKSPDKIQIPSGNMVLLNTLNYKNIDKWEQSNLDNSIEEIYELDGVGDINMRSNVLPDEPIG